MNSKDLRGLCEAYGEIYEDTLNEFFRPKLNPIDAAAERERTKARIKSRIERETAARAKADADKKDAPLRNRFSIGPGGFKFDNRNSRPAAGGQPRPAAGGQPRPAAGGQPRPSSTATPKVSPTPQARQTGDKVKDTQTWAKANPTLANKPQKTFNPLMQKTFGYQTGYSPNQTKGNIQKAKTLAGAGLMNSDYSWGSSSKLIDDISNAYQSVYEGKKIDQDQDGDNDFADVRIARMIASGMSKAEAIAAVKNKEYNEEFESWVDSLVEKGYDLSDYTMDEMFDIYLDEATLSAKAARAGKDIGAKGKNFAKIAASAGERYGSAEAGKRVAGAILKKMRANEEFELDEATRMRKELGKEGETRVRGELAARSRAYKRSGSVDKTIAAAEREADRTTPRGRDESQDDYKKRMDARSRTLRGLASSRRKSVRDKPRAGLRGYANKVEGGDKDLQRSRQRAMSAGTLTPKEKKQLGEDFNIWINGLLDEGYDLSDYTWDEMFEIYEETEEEKKRNERRARIAELQAQGRVMTSSKRTSQRAKQRREEQKAEKLERLANAALEATRGATRRSSKPMGTETPEPKAEAPKANRRLSSTVRNDRLASRADELLRMLQKEDFELWVDELLDEGYELDDWTDEELYDLYEEIIEEKYSR